MRETRNVDYLQKIYDKYPELDEKGLRKLCNFFMKQVYKYVYYGYDVNIINILKGEDFFFAKIMTNSKDPEFFNKIAVERREKRDKMREQLKAMPKAKPGEHNKIQFRIK